MAPPKGFVPWNKGKTNCYSKVERPSGKYKVNIRPYQYVKKRKRKKY